MKAKKASLSLQTESEKVEHDKESAIALSEQGDSSLENTGAAQKLDATTPQSPPALPPACWTLDDHQAFVAAIWKIGLQHSSPLVLAEHMHQPALITPDRLKSHLQKCRQAKEKELSDFLEEYSSFLQTLRRVDRLATSATAVDDWIQSQGVMTGGKLPGLLTRNVMKQEQGRIKTSSPKKAVANEKMLDYCTYNEDSFPCARIPLPELTKDEAKSFVGISLTFAIALLRNIEHDITTTRKRKMATELMVDLQKWEKQPNNNKRGSVVSETESSRQDPTASPQVGVPVVSSVASASSSAPSVPRIPRSSSRKAPPLEASRWAIQQAIGHLHAGIRRSTKPPPFESNAQVNRTEQGGSGSIVQLKDATVDKETRPQFISADLKTPDQPFTQPTSKAWQGSLPPLQKAFIRSRSASVSSSFIGDDLSYTGSQKPSLLDDDSVDEALRTIFKEDS